MEKRLLIAVLVPILFLAPHVLHAAVPEKAPEPRCLDCHPDKGEGKVVHPAVAMGCESCHVGTHTGEKPAPRLVAPVPDLCFTCHDRSPFEKKVMHAPVAAGTCLSCHNPHGSANPKMLVAAVPELCFTCHDKKAMVKADVHVSAVGGQCLTCHNPHGSDAAFVLAVVPESYCGTCHNDITPRHVMIRVSPNDSHPLKGRPDPLRKGKELTCTSCHNPHASDRERLSTKELKSPAPLCARCHTKVMVGQ